MAIVTQADEIALMKTLIYFMRNEGLRYELRNVEVNGVARAVILLKKPLDYYNQKEGTDGREVQENPIVSTLIESFKGLMSEEINENVED